MITPIADDCDLKKLYKEMYPDSANLIDFWKIVFTKISQYYQLEVCYRQDMNRWSILGQIPTPEDIEKIAPLLWEELSIYPRKFFKAIGLEKIFLCYHLSKNNKPSYGAIINNTLFIDIAQRSNTTLALTIHHEIYHQMETMSPGPTLSGGYDFYNQKIATRKTDKEVTSETFAYLLVDPAYMNAEAIKSAHLQHDLAQILLYVNNFAGDIKISNDKVSGEPILHNYLQFDRTREYKNSINKYTIQHPAFDKFIIIGLQGCGLSLLYEIINKNIEIKEYPYAIQQNESLLYMVRDPVDYCALRYHKYNEAADEAMQRWLVTYKSLAQQGLPFIKYEDIVTYNSSRISDFLKLINKDDENINWSVINEQRIGAYDISIVPLLRRVWVSVKRDPIMLFLGYTSNLKYN